MLFSLMNHTFVPGWAMIETYLLQPISEIWQQEVHLKNHTDVTVQIATTENPNVYITALWVKGRKSTSKQHSSSGSHGFFFFLNLLNKLFQDIMSSYLILVKAQVWCVFMSNLSWQKGTLLICDIIKQPYYSSLIYFSTTWLWNSVIFSSQHLQNEHLNESTRLV